MFSEMNYFHGNGYYYQGRNPQNYGHSINMSYHDNGQGNTYLTKAKAKAYINPRIINYEHLKRSMNQDGRPQTNKIHFNPNFKRTVTDGLQHGNNSQVRQGENSFAAEKIFGVNQKVVAPKPMETSQPLKVPVVKLTSQHKVVNKRNFPNSQTSSNNKNSFSQTNDKDKILGLADSSKVFHSHLSLKTNASKQLVNEKPMNMISGNRFKFISNKCNSKVMNSKKSGSEKCITHMYLSTTKLIAPNGKKLINKIVAKSKVNPKVLKKNSLNKSYSKYGVSDCRVTIKAASLVKNKYKVNKKIDNLIKYKIDKRKKKPETHSKKQAIARRHNITSLFPVYSHKHNHFNVLRRSFHCNFSGKRNTLVWRKDHLPLKKTCAKSSVYPNKRIIKIGGILYKSTSNKLTLANATKQTKTPPTVEKLRDMKKRVIKKGHIVYVRGEKFVLDKNGKTLIRQESKCHPKVKCMKFKRIDIGGVTYLQKSQNVLIRTNIHKARHIVNQAKHKSIATLSQLRKKSSLPCMMYHKFGKCIRHSKGSCMYKHDPKNIAVCKRFLKGECTDSNCLLSHEAIKEKMATCSFFLEGCCIRENCPFLHVKLNQKAEICEDFLHGFCTLGQQCLKRHLFQCPQFEKNENCKLGTKCPYPHKKKDSSLQSDSDKNSSDSCNIIYNVKGYMTDMKHQSMKNKRPILNVNDVNSPKSGKKAKKSKKRSTSDMNVSVQSPEIVECVPKRVKLKELPSFISLDPTNSS